MIFKILMFYICGYLKIEVEGVFVERFINICKSRGILLWKVRMQQGVKLYTNISISSFRKIRGIAKKTNTKIKIKKKCGIPFIFEKYKKRKVFMAVFLIVIISLFVVSNFIWNIEISGNENIQIEDIKELLNEQGIRIGTYKNKLNIDEIVNNIRLTRDDIAWVGIKIKGTNARIKIKETIKAPKIIDDDEYCNIIADKEGMITKISVQNGTINVKEGDIVKPGDILAYGYLEGKYTGIRYVHAIANVEAKVWYSKKEKVFLNQHVPTDTGREEIKYSIKFNNFEINFYKTLSNFKKYDTIISSKKLKIFSNFYLPIEFIKKTNKEYVIKDVKYTEEELIRYYYKKITTRIARTNG